MKRMGLGFLLVLTALNLMMSPALAAPGVRPPARVLSAADQAFLASLAGPAPVSAAKRPVIREKTPCHATVTCWDGSTVSCIPSFNLGSCMAWDSDCTVGEPGHVTCDGVTTWCPPCIDCDALEQQCSWGCDPCAYNFSCNASTGDSSCHCILRGCPQ